ncbi:zinc finger protein-like 1 isoform X2 [Bos indicus]|uniref:Zinc finger protein-like 1 n=1 Tax=Bos indicus TaxID=9915 RepID=A0A6P5BK29_BOSIN|nr:PREDICTED: zinc finger protein-like 1 isoform X2 [Bos indicus]XP_024843052.1 zinc finger protein-like 1 isoform X2 [Bos taurus]XP_027387838.1 zinc finger protein-like 1 isoform X2 [Bos indicus x Bos taurus]
MGCGTNAGVSGGGIYAGAVAQNVEGRVDYGTLQVPQEEGDQPVLLRTPGQRLRALPGSQSRQDLFHWACLNERAAQLPRNTAPAGYQCPSCSGPIFPPTNLAGPVASALREKLATVNWARAGLGLPLIDELVSPEPEPLNTSEFSDWSSFNASGSPEQEETASASAAPAFYSQVPRPPASPSRPEQHTVIHMGNPEPLTHASAPRKVYDTRDDERAPGLHRDCDDDKYRRRPALGWLAQLLRSRAGSRKRPLTLLQRAGLLLLLGLLGFLALLALMSRLGRAAADSDPNLDPLMNPHIRVGPS